MSAGVPAQYAGAAVSTATIMAPASYSPTTAMATQIAVTAPTSYAAPVTSIVAAPTCYAAPMTTTVAAPTSYAAPIATTVATQASYAAPMAVAAPVSYAAPTSYAAPMTTTMSAPTVTTMAAPAAYAPVTTQTASYVTAPQVMPVTTQAPSYVAASQVMSAPVVQAPAMLQQQLIPAVAPPAAPVKLTQGIPTPEQIQQQKSGYSVALDKQLKEAVDTVQKETQIEKEMLKFTAEKNMALHAMQVEEKLAESLALADEGATIKILELKKALVERQLQLDNQANGLMMDYQLKSLQTDFAQKKYGFDQQYVKAENALAQDYNKQVAAANTGTTYSVPAQAVPAPQAALAAAPKK